MNFKKLFDTKVHITYVVKKHLRNALPVFFILLASLYFGQEKKLDFRFKTLLKNKDNLAKGTKVREVEAIQKELDSHLVVTSKGTKTMYSCIIYTKSPEKLKSEGFLIQSILPNFVTALVSIEDIEKLLTLPYVTAIMSPTFGNTNNDVSRSQSGASLLQDGVLNNTAYNGTGILVGIYDTGIDWSHPDFRMVNNQARSRIHSIWDQTITAQGTETPPAGFNTGVEYTRAQIDDEIDGTPTNFVRERDINGHGTHVAGTAAGNGAGFADTRHKGFASDADIVVVKGGNGSFPSTNTINALTYFRNVATALNRPIVVNMSIGGQLNGHDGTTAEETAVNNFTASGPGRVVVISAGNDFEDNIHRSLTIPANGNQTFTFNVGSNTTDHPFSFIMYANNSTNITSRLTTPDGLVYVQNFNGSSSQNISGGGFNAIMENDIDTDNNRSYAYLAIRRATGSTVNSQGAYRLEITNNGTGEIVTHGWLLSFRDSNSDILTQLQNGDGNNTIGSPGGATSAVTVAAYTGRVNFMSGVNDNVYGIPGTVAEGIAGFSSMGPRVDGVLKPDITASGQFVVSAMSADSPESQNPQTITRISDRYLINQGTSMASPGVAGAVALLLQANPALTAVNVKARLTNNARRDAATGNVPNPRWGYGKLDIYKAVANEIGCATSEFESINYDTQNYLHPSNGYYNFDNSILAVRYTPSRTGKLGGINVFTGANQMSDVAFNIEIRKVDAAGNPGDLIATRAFTSIRNTFYRGGWNYLNLSDMNVNISTKEDFYVLIDTRNGRISLWRDNANADGRSKSSTNGTTWSTSTAGNYRIRAVVYEDKPGVKKLATINTSQASTIAAGKNYFINNCQLIARVEKETTSTVSGNVTSKVWVDAAQPNYVARRYEINPVTEATTATGKVTLYFTQEDFDSYNAANAIKLPTSSTDDANKGNLMIEKYTGTSAGNVGTTASFGSAATVVPVNVSNIVWNDTYKYWEVTFQNTGFGGYFVKTASSLGTIDLKSNAEVSITPNPAKDFVVVMLGRYSTGTVVIYDASGKLVKTEEVSRSSNKVDVSALVKGMYVFNITLNDKTVITKKVIKE